MALATLCVLNPPDKKYIMIFNKVAKYFPVERSTGPAGLSLYVRVKKKVIDILHVRFNQITQVIVIHFRAHPKSLDDFQMVQLLAIFRRLSSVKLHHTGSAAQRSLLHIFHRLINKNTYTLGTFNPVYNFLGIFW